MGGFTGDFIALDEAQDLDGEQLAVISREAWEACQDAEADARAAGKVSFGVAVSGIRNRPNCQITAMTGR